MRSQRRPHARPVSRGGSRGRKWLLSFLGLAALAAVGLGYLLSRPPKPPALTPASESAEKPPTAAKPRSEAKPHASPKKAPPERQNPKAPAETESQVARPRPATHTEPSPSAAPATYRLALVIDDLGRSLAEVERLEGLGVSVSYAVLPFESRTREVVAALASRRREVLCHLPMEPEGGNNPGPGALKLGMAMGELNSATRAALDAVPGAVGVNNHMGSKMSADRDRMAAVLGVIAGRGLYFLDSRTSAESVGFQTALEIGVPAAERQVFLDRDPAPGAIDEQFARWLELARDRGAAIAIGHPYPSTFEVLEREVPKARAQGFEFVPVSYLLHNPGDGPL